MTFRAKSIVLLSIFGTGVALIWIRQPTPVTLTPATPPHAEQGSQETVTMPVPKPAESVAGSSRKPKPTNDDFAFVAHSARNALDGDGRAALRIGDVLGKCMWIKHQY